MKFQIASITMDLGKITIGLKTTAGQENYLSINVYFIIALIIQPSRTYINFLKLKVA